jgi:multiple sugar transport system substrate-binding protein
MRIGRGAATVALFVVIASGCTGDSEPESGSSGAMPTGPVTLSLWIFEGEEEFLPALKEAFETEYPNITLKITDIPEDNYVTKMDTALAADSPPDIGWVYEARWMKAGRVLPLDDVIASNQIDLSVMNQNAMSGCVYEGVTYCLGSYTGAVMLFYNKDLFDKAGLPYPSASTPPSPRSSRNPTRISPSTSSADRPTRRSGGSTRAPTSARTAGRSRAWSTTPRPSTCTTS